MLKSLRFLAWTTSLALLFGGMATWARAAEAPAGGLIGVVDMEKVSQQAEPVKNAYKELNDTQERLMRNLQELDQYAYLSAAELREFAAILDTPGELSQGQKLRSGELKQLANDREKEWQQLAQVANPTPEQKAKMQDLARMRNEKDTVLQEIQKKYQATLNTKAQEILPKLSKQVDDVIAAVAKDQKLAIVLSRKVTTPTGGEEVVLYGGVDISDEIIKRLNKK
ncbi:MAG: OmpH family outer membrane protein [Armatimonadota bacterium]|nr:OmpH family outer membrane protein [Armatimonadota bacterium]